MMNTGPTPQATEILKQVSAGEAGALDALMGVVYDDLKSLAEHHMRRERANHTLQATAVVHEAYMRLIDQQQADWKDRAHFLALASHMIRRILVDHARARLSEKRGSGRERESVTLAVDFADEHRIVELRFFGGLTIEEIAEATAMSKRSVDRGWAFAKAWLFRELQGDEGSPASTD